MAATPLAMSTALDFSIDSRCPDTRARTGRLTLGHGTVQTPVFMPVGTAASVKALSPRDLTELGAEMILGNTYHLYLRPGHELVEKMGKLNRFMGWDRPILTDSGGYQVFSMTDLSQVDDDGVSFTSHIDGSRHRFTPEHSMAVQAALGADIAMVFDECLEYPATREVTARSTERSLAWARRSKAAHQLSGQALFGIVQGGFEDDLRIHSAQATVEMGFDGYAIGGLSVGEPKHLMHHVAETVVPHLPEEAPRYLMGVGLPIDLIEGVSRGIDMFDCVMPTRHARTASLFTGWSRINIKNARFRDDPEPIEAGCTCYTCRNFSRAYLRHLFVSGEILGRHLNTIHNVHHYLSLMRRIRQAIAEGRFAAFHRESVNQYLEETTHV
ncbi:MAG: tRNA guanosine(34) transglycosylase Tgt [Leptospirillia bacterium]